MIIKNKIMIQNNKNHKIKLIIMKIMLMNKKKLLLNMKVKNL